MVPGTHHSLCSRSRKYPRLACGRPRLSSLPGAVAQHQRVTGCSQPIPAAQRLLTANGSGCPGALCQLQTVRDVAKLRRRCVETEETERAPPALLRNAFGEILFILESCWHCRGAYVVEATPIPALLLPACLHLKRIKESCPAQPNVAIDSET